MYIYTHITQHSLRAFMWMMALLLTLEFVKCCIRVFVKGYTSHCLG